MGMWPRVGMVVVSLGFFLLSAPPSHAADDDVTAEAAQVESGDTHDLTREQILEEIEATRTTDPELAAEMEHQFQQWESGELDLTAERQAAFETAATAGQGAPELIGPPVDGTMGGGMPDYMTPELGQALQQVFESAGRGELTDEQARGQAEAIMREHGIDPREIGPDHERDGVGWGRGIDDGSVVFDRGSEQGKDYKDSMERAGEHMSPEAREQMERFFEGSEGTSREFEGASREFEGQTREFEAATHEYEAATREFEAATHEYEAPTREFEATTREYEAPTHEYEAPEAPQHEYEAPEAYEAPQHEYEMPEQQQYEAPPQY